MLGISKLPIDYGELRFLLPCTNRIITYFPKSSLLMIHVKIAGVPNMPLSSLECPSLLVQIEDAGRMEMRL
jgi:hypothetical protein